MRSILALFSFFFVLALGLPALAAAPLCNNSSRPCEESNGSTLACDQAGVLKCLDFNDMTSGAGNYDGFGFNNWFDSHPWSGSPGDVGIVTTAAGWNGTKGYRSVIPAAVPSPNVQDGREPYFDTGIGSKNQIYTRFLIRFSPNYQHDMRCGLQKILYHALPTGNDGRMLLGINRLNQIPGHSGEPVTTGVFQYDTLGHHVHAINEAGGDIAKPILGNVWYSVEFMTNYIDSTHNQTKIWIDGELVMTSNNDLTGDTPGYTAYSVVQPAFEFGGSGTPTVCVWNSVEQWVDVDNYVISTAYIGPPAGFLGPPDTTPPTDPASLAATPISDTRIDLAWTASTDNVAVTGYRIERCVGAGCGNFTEFTITPSNSYSNTTGLTGSTTYRYRVRAMDGAGNNSGYSNISSATTLPPPIPPPVLNP